VEKHMINDKQAEGTSGRNDNVSLSGNSVARSYLPGAITADAHGNDSSNELAVATQRAWEEAHQNFTRLRALHANSVVGFLCNRAKQCGVWLDRTDLENLSQDVWTLIWQALSRPGAFRPGSFEGWLFKISLNCLRQWLANKQRHHRQLSFDPDQLCSSRTRSSPLQDLHHWELKERLDHFLEALKALERVDADSPAGTVDSLPAATAGRPRKDVELHRAVQRLHTCVRRVMHCINRVRTA
jgi:DNA-directed RNA polymerase specialized sigma24 family protein